MVREIKTIVDVDSTLETAARHVAILSRYIVACSAKPTKSQCYTRPAKI
jgi:hypothetical protein